MAGRQSPGVVAARLLSWLGEQVTIDASAATPLDELAARLGIAVTSFSAEMMPGALGYLEPGEDLIFMRVGLPDSVRRFTLAHELGHAALHRRAGLAAEIGAAGGDWTDESEVIGCDDLDLATPADSDDETLRPGQAYSMRAQREGEANAFAAALLMPAAATLAAYAALCARDVERPALALAQQFGVSEDVALRRLAALLTSGEDDESIETAQSSAPTAPAAPLDPEQRRAARTPTPALVVAGPGSGKTSALLARIAYLLDEQGVAPERVLALTYSRKATEELRSRLTRQLGDRDGMPQISTIHAFCGDTLRRYGALVGLRPEFRLMTQIEGYFLLRRVVSRAPQIHYTPLNGPTMHFKDLLGAISRMKDDLIEPAAYRAAAEDMARNATTPGEREAAERALEVAALYTAYQAALEERGDVDYGDLIAKMARLLREAPEVADDLRGRYEHILVDEFQDVNYAIGALLRELAGRRGALWAVGDADQAIYRFRGGSPASMLRFERDFEGARVIQLDRNYRSRPQILRAASAFASAYLPAERRTPLRATRADTSTQPAVILATAPDAEAELDGLARMMREHVAAGVPLSQQAVLLRTRKYVKQVCEGLRARGIPAQLAAPLLDQPLVRALLATVDLADDARGIGLMRAGDLSDHTFSRDDAAALLRVAHEQHVPPFEALHTSEAQAALTPAGAAGLRRLERITEELRAAPSVAVGISRYIFSLTTLGRRLLDDRMGAEATQVARLLDICRTFDDQRAGGALLREGELAPQVADWAGLRDYIAALRELGQEAGDIQRASDDDMALVLTAHAGKGLEFPIVYLPQLVKRRFPLSQRPENVPPPPGLLREDEASAGGTLRDEANLFYVSLTRARDTLVLSHARHYGRQNYTPSEFLTPIEEALGDELQRIRWERDPEPDGQAADSPADQATTTVTPADASAAERVIALSELEAYLRCPQQYAYRYVYGLRPALAAPVALRSAYHDASAELRSRFAAGAQPSLEEALALFDERWHAAHAEATSATGEASAADGEQTLSAVYTMHGQRAIERLWRALRRSGGLAEEDDGDMPDASDALHAGAVVTASVSLAGATITGSLDHVEQEPAARVARYEHGKLTGEPQARDLFYALAAEQMRQAGRPVEVVRVSLANGDVKPLRMTDKRQQRLEEDVSAALAGLRRESYPPDPEPHKCASCPFALVCPA